MASSLEVNKVLAAVLTAGIIASGAGVVSRIIFHPQPTPEEHAYPIEVTEAEGGGAEPAEQEEPFAALLASGSLEHGQAAVKACGACHTFGKGEPNKIGPQLYGVIGRDIASVADFSYSSALQDKQGAWDYENLNEFLTSPRDWAAGTKMTFAGLKKSQDRADVILYLRSLSDNPSPLPEAPAAEAAPAGQEQAAAEPAEPQGQQPAVQEAPADQEQAAAVEAPKTEAGAPPAGGGGDFAQLLASADPTVGERAAKKCQACHSFDAGGGPSKIGPGLHGVVGRDIASAEGFSYSSALEGKEGAWDYQNLDQFLTNPKEFVPGTNMSFIGLKKAEERAAVIVYLRSITDDPPPLPGSG